MNLYYVVLLFNLIFISILVGFRHEVGGDWSTYLSAYDSQGIIRDKSLLYEPGYQLISWISYQLDAGIYGVNLIAAIISIWFFSFL